MVLVKRPLQSVLSLSALAALAILAAVPASASAAVTKEDCAAQFGLGGSSEISAVMQDVTPESLKSGSRSYNQSLKQLLVMPASTPTFVSSLPERQPAGKKAKAAYQQKVKDDLAKRKKLAGRAQDRLKDLYSDARKDISDTSTERDLAIRSNSTNAKTRISNLKLCNTWNAESDFITGSRTREDSYTAALQNADSTYLTSTRSVEDTYQAAVQASAGQDIKEQKQCSQDSSYGYNDQGDWVQTAITIPHVLGFNETDARNILTYAGFQDVIVKKVQSNNGKVGLTVATNPAIGSRVTADIQITVLIRSNKKKVKGLEAGQIADPAAKPKKPKGKPKAKPVLPSQPLPKKTDTSQPGEQQVQDCQSRQEDDPQHGSDSDTDQAKTDLDRDLDDAKSTYRSSVDGLDSSYSREVEDLRRNLTNPFKFTIPYSNALSSVSQMIKVTQLRSKRQKTEDQRSARDAAKAASNFLTDMYNIKVSA